MGRRKSIPPDERVKKSLRPKCKTCGRSDPRMLHTEGWFYCGHCIGFDPSFAEHCGLTSDDLIGRDVKTLADAEELARELGRQFESTLAIVDERLIDQKIRYGVKERGLDLKMILPQMWEQAVEAFDAADPIGFLLTASNTASLALVFDNWATLKHKGIFETALFHAYTGTRTNHAGWSIPAIRSLFDLADREKLRAAGEPLPSNGPFNLFRGVAGYGNGRKVNGFSWTDSIDVACWFAWRFSEVVSNPEVFELSVPAEDVYVFTLDRKEREFIVSARGNPKNLNLSASEIEAGHNRKRATHGSREVDGSK